MNEQAEPTRKHWTQGRSATERMKAARNAHLETRTRELLWAGVGSRLWPSFLCRPKYEDAMFPWEVHIETPAGWLVYRLGEGDLPIFEHISDRREAHSALRCTQDDKLARLMHLATEGW